MIKLTKKINYKKTIFLLLIILLINFIVIYKKTNSFYAVQYGGRIIKTIPIAVCSNPNTSSVCTFCGQGSWFQVSIQPSGGSGFYFCPTFSATKGNNPTYAPGGYVITGGSNERVLDPMNTAAVVKKDKIKGNLMLAWFKVKTLLIAKN